MLAAIFLGVVGFLCAIFLTILAGTALMYLDTPAIVAIHIKILIVFAVLRGILHYAEQALSLIHIFPKFAEAFLQILRKLLPQLL